MLREEKKTADYLQDIRDGNDIDVNYSKVVRELDCLNILLKRDVDEETEGSFKQVKPYTPGQVADMLLAAKAAKKVVENLMDDVGRVAAAYQSHLISVFDKMDVDKFSTESGSVSVKDSPTFKVVDPKALMKWIKENGYTNKLILHSKTLASIGQERLQAGEPLPDGVVYDTFKKVNTRRK